MLPPTSLPSSGLEPAAIELMRDGDTTRSWFDSRVAAGRHNRLAVGDHLSHVMRPVITLIGMVRMSPKAGVRAHETRLRQARSWRRWSTAVASPMISTTFQRRSRRGGPVLLDSGPTTAAGVQEIPEAARRGRHRQLLAFSRQHAEAGATGSLLQRYNNCCDG